MQHGRSRRALVLGASGLIGSAVVRALLRSGWSATGICRPNGRGIESSSHNFSVMRADLSGPVDLKPLALGVDAIVIAAAIHGPEHASADISLLHSALSVAAETGARLIYTSGAAVYGNPKPPTETDEACAIRPLPIVSHRSLTEALIAEANANGAPVHSIRPGWVWGARGALIARLVRRLSGPDASVALPGVPDGPVPFVHRDDLAELYVSVLETAPANAAFNAASEHLHRHQVAKLFTGGRYRSIAVDDAADQVGPIADLLAQSIQLSSLRARNVLGWRPNHHLTTEGKTHAR